MRYASAPSSLADAAARHSGGGPRVLILQEWVPRYRVEFFEALKDALAARGAHLTVAHGQPDARTAARKDAAAVQGALARRSRALGVAGRSAVWQPWRDQTASADLIVVNEGMRFVLNYLLLARQRLGYGPPVAYWGHGANHSATTRATPLERARTFVYRLPRWWFAYTEGGKRRLAALGCPRDRITVVQNSVATTALKRAIDAVGTPEIAELRGRLGLQAGPIGLFLGSLYDAKRIDFLIEASDAIAASLPGFSLLIGGDGPSHELARRLSASRPHVHLLGRVDGRAKAVLLRAADLLLQPSAVGLSITEAACASLPVVAMADSGHGPEIEYLEDGANGVLVRGDDSPAAYAEAVVSLLGDAERLRALSAAAGELGRRYSGEAAVARFADGLARFAAAENRPFPPPASCKCSDPQPIPSPRRPGAAPSGDR